MKADVEVKNIDLSRLSQQKAMLLTIQESLTGEQYDAIDGILCIIDAIQDYAVDVLCLPEGDVFCDMCSDEVQYYLIVVGNGPQVMGPYESVDRRLREANKILRDGFEGGIVWMNIRADGTARTGPYTIETRHTVGRRVVI
jgi:hypothetical protein